MVDERERILCRERVYASVDFLNVEEDARERGREVERGVGSVVRLGDEGVGVGLGGEGGGGYGGVVDVGGGGRVGHN